MRFFKMNCPFCGAIAVGNSVREKAYCTKDRSHVSFLRTDSEEEDISKAEHNRLLKVGSKVV